MEQAIDPPDRIEIEPPTTQQVIQLANNLLYDDDDLDDVVAELTNQTNFHKVIRLAFEGEQRRAAQLLTFKTMEILTKRAREILE